MRFMHTGSDQVVQLVTYEINAYSISQMCPCARGVAFGR